MKTLKIMKLGSVEQRLCLGTGSPILLDSMKELIFSPKAFP